MPADPEFSPLEQGQRSVVSRLWPRRSSREFQRDLPPTWRLSWLSCGIKEEFLECAQGWSRAKRRLSLVLAFLGMLGVPLDTPVLLDGQLQLLEGWELGI